MHIESMKSAAMNATPGTWYISCENGFQKRISSIIDANQFFDEKILHTYKTKSRKAVSKNVISSSEWTQIADKDAEFIIACSPENVLELINKYETLLRLNASSND